MTDTEHTEFRRLVLDLCAIATNGDVMRMAADLARLLHLDLQGLYVEDPALALLADLPCVRELRLPGVGWEKFDANRITAEIQQETARAARHLAEISAAAGVPSGFETRRGNAVEIIASSDRSDIVLIVEPRILAQRLGDAFMQHCRAAYRSAASVLLVPAAPLRTHGTVVVVLAAADEAGLVVGARIAHQAREDLVLLLTDATQQRVACDRALSLGLQPTHLHIRPLPNTSAAGIAHALAGLHPRLLVLTRGSALGQDVAGLFRLASERGVPVLAVEPRNAAPAAGA